MSTRVNHSVRKYFVMIGVLAAAGFAGACAGPDEAGGGDENCCAVTITVSVPKGTPALYLTGNIPELGPWDPDRFTMKGEGATRSATLRIPRDTAFEYKFTLGTWDREALGPSGTVMANYKLKIRKDTKAEHAISDFRKDPREFMADWQASGVKGTLVYWQDVESEYLEHDRHVVIWLPPQIEGPEFNSDPVSRFPVLYMHDGQNLFDPRMRADGEIWDVDDAIVRLVEVGEIPPVIVVGVFNSENRAYEYSPWHGAGDYARFLIEELMPRVNSEFATLTGPGHTAVMGSSMGGLLSYYLVSNHPDVFGACGCISSHFSLSEAMVAEWTGNESVGRKADKTPFILDDIRNGLSVPEGVRYWFDYGTRGIDAAYKQPHEALHRALVDQGLVEGKDFVIREYKGADHNEASWRERLEDPLRFLF